MALKALVSMLRSTRALCKHGVRRKVLCYVRLVLWVGRGRFLEVI